MIQQRGHAVGGVGLTPGGPLLPAELALVLSPEGHAVLEVPGDLMENSQEELHGLRILGEVIGLAGEHLSEVGGLDLTPLGVISPKKLSGEAGAFLFRSAEFARGRWLQELPRNLALLDLFTASPQAGPAQIADVLAGWEYGRREAARGVAWDRSCPACGTDEASSADEVFEGATLICQGCRAALVAEVLDGVMGFSLASEEAS